MSRYVREIERGRRRHLAAHFAADEVVVAAGAVQSHVSIISIDESGEIDLLVGDRVAPSSMVLILTDQRLMLWSVSVAASQLKEPVITAPLDAVASVSPGTELLSLGVVVKFKDGTSAELTGRKKFMRALVDAFAGDEAA